MNSNANNFRERGFTILELVIGLALFGVISAGIAVLFDIYRPYSSLVSGGIFKAGVSRVHSETLEDIKQNVRQAERILATTSADSVTYTTGTTTLVLRLRSVDVSNNPIPGFYDNVVFYTDTSTPPITLYKRIVGASGSKRSSRTAILNNWVGRFSMAYNTSTPSIATAVEVDLVTLRSIGPMKLSATSTIRAAIR